MSDLSIEMPVGRFWVETLGHEYRIGKRSHVRGRVLLKSEFLLRRKAEAEPDAKVGEELRSLRFGQHSFELLCQSCAFLNELPSEYVLAGVVLNLKRRMKMR